MEIDYKYINKKIEGRIFAVISEEADRLGVDAYVVGGYVRDIFLGRKSKDIDVVCVGSGIELAEAVADKLKKSSTLTVFKNFGTAQVKYRNTEIEFVG
ncbi:MAG: tRNA nucleotidyltransferase, partial [Dysgonamonadaceae bacterium]|nr:tRNA nucleotidyltransferase [Dysgonamonadaceae bacterium]